MTAPAPDFQTKCVIDGRRNRQDGALTCSRCLADLDALLDPRNGGTQHTTHLEPASVPVLFALLDPRPGRGGGTRGAPGYASTLPLSAHVVDMRGRTAATLDQWAGVVAYERKVEKPRVMIDLRPQDTDRVGPMSHREHDHAIAPRLIDSTVPTLAGFLRRHLDWTTRQAWVSGFASNLRDLRAKLRPATGDLPPKPIGTCPNLVQPDDLDQEPHTCRAPLRVAPYSDAVRCPACGRGWLRQEWLRLGLLIDTPPDDGTHARTAVEAKAGERGADSYPDRRDLRGQWGMPREEDRPTRQAIRHTTTGARP